ncbi:MAG: hypothetical protein AB7S26_28510 [Sandaracinaceae bacterium]
MLRLLGGLALAGGAVWGLSSALAHESARAAYAETSAALGQTDYSAAESDRRYAMVVRTLEEARRAAALVGLGGALFGWALFAFGAAPRVRAESASASRARAAVALDGLSFLALVAALFATRALQPDHAAFAELSRAGGLGLLGAGAGLAAAGRTLGGWALGVEMRRPDGRAPGAWRGAVAWLAAPLGAALAPFGWRSGRAPLHWRALDVVATRSVVDAGDL